MRYGIAISLLLGGQFPSGLHAFQSRSSTAFKNTALQRPSRNERIILSRQEVSAYAPAEEDNDNGNSNNNNNPTSITTTANSIIGKNSNMTAAFTSMVTLAVQTDDDAEEIELAERRRRIIERSGGNYRVTLPLRPSGSMNSVSQPSGIIGMAIRQYSSGLEISNQVLQLDSLAMETIVDKDDDDDGTVTAASDNDNHMDNNDNTLETIGRSAMKERLDPNTSGLYVHSVQVGSPAWKAGIKPGDLLISTAATFGEALWPKTTLEGVRSALTSRRMVSPTATFELRHTDAAKIDNVYELTLTRPIGLNLRETNDGYVEVVGFTNTAPNLVRQAVKVCDRVIAVDSSLGDQLWPVSTVEGVISACTSRLPGQQITMRFERPEANMKSAVNAAVVLERPPMEQLKVPEESQQLLPTSSEDQKVLLKRCRDILRRYALEAQEASSIKKNANQRTAKFVNKFAVPAMVADKVMEALAKASASVDSVTLSMIMDAYLSCRKPNGAIQAFEAAVGVNGNGSILLPKGVTENSRGSNKIVPNPDALNVYTISSLLKAHAMKRDLKSVRRVVAAMEGRGGERVSGLETAMWPGAGSVIVPDTQCYNIAISAAAKAGTADGLQLALKLFESLNEPSIIFRAAPTGKPEKNTVTYNSIISALTLAGRFDDAFNVFFTMKRVGLKPDKFTYTSLLKACVNDGDLQELLIDMKEQGVKDDVVMYNAMIRSLCEEGNLAEARTLITQMESKGVTPDSRTYGILMKGLLKAGKPGACLALFDTATNNEQTSQMTENVYLYTTAVSAAAALGDHERALDLVSRMSAVGVKPNTRTLTALMGACLANERPDLAAQVYKRIESPDGYAMSQGLEALCRSGDLSSAAQILSTQQRGNRDLSGKQLMQAYETVISTAARYGDFEMARAIFSELLAKSYIPSKAMFKTIIGAMGWAEKGHIVLDHRNSKREQFQFLLFMIDSLQNRKLDVDAFLYSATIACGNQLNDPCRDMALLLVQARAASDESKEKSVLLDDDPALEPLSIKWEDILAKDEILQKLKSNSALLPPLHVSIGKRDSRTVFFAENSLSRTRQPEEPAHAAIP